MLWMGHARGCGGRYAGRIAKEIRGGVVALALLAAAPAAAGPFPSAIEPGDLDLDACASFRGGEQRPVTPAAVDGVLGIGEGGGWSAGSVTGKLTRSETETFLYRVAFHRPVAIGTVLMSGGAVSYLHPDAPFPGDPAQPDHWIEAPRHPNQHTPHVVPLPPGTTTRAALWREALHAGASRLTQLHLLRERLLNVAPFATANASGEYGGATAQSLASGLGAWYGSGVNREGFNLRPPVSDVHSDWLVLSWDEPRRISVLWMEDNIREFKLFRFAGPTGVNPAAGTGREWRRIREFGCETIPIPHPDHDGRQHRITFDPPLETRGLRILVEGVGRPYGTYDKPDSAAARYGQVSMIARLHVLEPLGDAPVPAPKADDAVPPPFEIAYDLPDGGFFTLAVDRRDGTRARNIAARVERGAGRHAERWDLRDEKGAYMEPGDYRWKALLHPGLELHYRMTPYPNVRMNTDDRAPWPSDWYGRDGWMSDHVPPEAAAAAGGIVLLGSREAESGVPLIATDTSGRKLAAAGVKTLIMAANDKTVFLYPKQFDSQPHAVGRVLAPGAQAIFSVDVDKITETNAIPVRAFAYLEPTESRHVGIRGLAASAEHVFVAVDSGEMWLEGAATTADIDIERCLPAYPPARPPRRAHEVVPNPRHDFLRLFRLTGTPPGRGEDGDLYRLNSTRGPGRNHIVLAFKKPVPIGSVVFPPPAGQDYHVFLSVLKPDAPYPPRPENDAHWIDFDGRATHRFDVLAAPENMETRALRITFYRGEDDLFSRMQSQRTAAGPSLPGVEEEDLDARDELSLGDERGWMGAVDGMKLLRRRYRNLFASARVRVNSGTVAPDGTWDAQRKEPLSEAEPAIYALEWDTPQALRGLAIEEIDGARTLIDVYTGPEDGKIPFDGDAHWTQVAEYEQTRRNHYGNIPSYNGLARYMDGYIGFGREVVTRAIRLRVVEPWTSRGRLGVMEELGVRPDRGGAQVDVTRCRVYGVAPLQYLGGEIPVDSLCSKRIEVRDVGAGTLVDEIPIERPGHLAYAATSDTLYALCNGVVWKVARAAPHEHAPLIEDALKPTALTCDAAGNVYVYDGAPERGNVRVYDGGGKLLRTIGTPGPRRAGPWDATKMFAVSALAIDASNQLWAVEHNWWPKRIVVWTLDGRFVREHLGNTGYGGGGTINPFNPTQAFYGPMEFELDWTNRQSRLKGLTTVEPGWPPVAEFTVIDGRTYGTSQKPGAAGGSPVGVVYQYVEGAPRPVAALGFAQEFGPLKAPDILTGMGVFDLVRKSFLWCDRNGDGRIQAPEVELWDGMALPQGFSRDLSALAGEWLFSVREFLPGGAPLYERKRSPGGRYRLLNGNFLGTGWGEPGSPIHVATPEGKTLWTYRTEGAGVPAHVRPPPWHPAQIACQGGLAGNEVAHAGELGEFFVLHGMIGGWHLMTADGLLAADLFRDRRDPRSTGTWGMPEHHDGLRLDDVSIGDEHFEGFFCRTSDNRYLGIAGHNHVSIFEVVGLDRFRRLEGTVTVTQADLERMRAWEREDQARRVYARAPVIDMNRIATVPTIDGSAGEWGPAAGVLYDGLGNLTLHLGYDDRFLYLCFSGVEMGPMLNSGTEPRMLFKTGAAVELSLGLDPEAAPRREAPVAGDKRLLLTLLRGKPVAVLYEPVVPGTDEAEVWTVESPTGRTSFDRARVVADARVTVRNWMNPDPKQTCFCVEAAIPLEALGMKPEPGGRARMDWGMLLGGREGNQVLQRLYWANQATATVSDAPSEARLHPALWGYVRFAGEREVLRPDMEIDSKPGMADDFIEELLDDLK